MSKEIGTNATDLERRGIRSLPAFPELNPRFAALTGRSPPPGPRHRTRRVANRPLIDDRSPALADQRPQLFERCRIHIDGSPGEGPDSRLPLIAVAYTPTFGNLLVSEPHRAAARLLPRANVQIG